MRGGAKLNADDLHGLIWTHAWQRAWSMIGEAEVLRHNFTILVASDNRNERIAASRIVADTIAAVMFGSLVMMGEA